MSWVSFEQYARLAATTASDTEAAGRYRFQSDAERHIVADVAHKLAVRPGDRLLDIGCGPGNLLLPLSALVADACGIDNEAAINRLRARAGVHDRVRTIAGNFLDADLPDGVYDKILVYSVIQYLADVAEVDAFVTRAVSLLAAGGRLLIGDLPNADKKARFTASPAGQRARTVWHDLAGSAGHPLAAFPGDPLLIAVDDQLILHLVTSVRRMGYDAYVLPQPPDLPFGHSREDILVVAPH